MSPTSTAPVSLPSLSTERTSPAVVYTIRHLPLSFSRSRSPPGARFSSVACARAASASSAGEATHPRHVPSTARRSARLASSTSEADEEAGDDVSARAALADTRGPRARAKRGSGRDESRGGRGGGRTRSPGRDRSRGARGEGRHGDGAAARRCVPARAGRVLSIASDVPLFHHFRRCRFDRHARSSDETRLIGTAVGEDLRLSRDRPAPSRARRKARALPRSLPSAGRSPPTYRCSPPPHRCSRPLVAPLPLLLSVLARHPTVLAADVARRSLSAAASSSALDIGSLLALLLLSHGAAAVCRVITSPVMAR